MEWQTTKYFERYFAHKMQFAAFVFFSLFYIFFTFEYSSSYIQRRVADLA